jgi:hypothetical protein
MDLATIWVISTALGLGLFGLGVMFWVNHQAKKH